MNFTYPETYFKILSRSKPIWPTFCFIHSMITETLSALILWFKKRQTILPG